MSEKLVTLIKESVGTGFRLSLHCNTCAAEFPLTTFHHIKCPYCLKAYCGKVAHKCEQPKS